MSGAAAGDEESKGIGEPGRPQHDPGQDPGDRRKRHPARGVVITIIGALVTGGVAGAGVSSGLVGGGGTPGGSNTAQSEQRCNANTAPAPHTYTGLVAGFLTDAQVANITRSVEVQVGSKVNPAYVPLKHVVVKGHWGNRDFQTMAAIPAQLSVKSGDAVELDSRYRDPTLPCHFIPWTVTRLINGGK
jgi:hypothetical protein